MSRWDANEDRGGDPQPGSFLLRLVRGGPQVPAMITNARGLWQAKVNGESRTAHANPAEAPDVYRIWHGGVRAQPEECDYLDALREWARTGQPNHPLLHPRQPIDVALMAPLVPQPQEGFPP
mgnify:FL=1